MLIYLVLGEPPYTSFFCGRGNDMKLIEFSVNNYRSITQANRIKLQDFTVLVGKNNEGKSNLLKALNVAMQVLTNNNSASNRYIPEDDAYVWERDFPFQLKDRRNGLTSIFSLRFTLEDDELDEFHRQTKIRGNSEINITIKIGKDNNPVISIPKRGCKSYNEKRDIVIKFVCQRIKFNPIQAVRTDDMAKSTLSNLIYSRLKDLRNDPAFIEAEKKVEELKQKTLNEIAPKLINPLKVFLPQLNDVKIKLLDKKNDYFFGYYANPFDIIIDDGIATSISAKGDGIKSIVTLALLKELRSEKNGTSIIAIEEPESHLHSGAIHSLVDVINKLSENSQVIISTHNPLFVRRNPLSSNIIIDCGTARPAKTIEDVRNILGVWTSDNLTNARYVFFVEGEDDKISLTKILSAKSQIIANALKTGQLLIKSLNGAGNLVHDVNDVKNSLCDCVVLLDDDEAGKTAGANAVSSCILDISQIRYTKCKGSTNSEFEDCLQPAMYASAIREKFRVDITTDAAFRGNAKWSDRVRQVFLNAGYQWNDRTESSVKYEVANAIPTKIDNLDSVLIPQKSSFIQGVVDMIEAMMGELSVKEKTN